MGQAKASAIWVAPLEALALKERLRFKPNGLEECQGIAVCANQGMLTIVKERTLVNDALGSPTGCVRGLKKVDFQGQLSGFNGCGQARPAGAQNGDFLRHCKFQKSPRA